MAAFGYDAKSVIVSEKNGNVVAAVKYDNYQVTMSFIPDSKEYYEVVFGDKSIMLRGIDISYVYRLGFEKFVDMLRTKKLSLPLENLYATVELMNTDVKSYETVSEGSLDKL